MKRMATMILAILMAFATMAPAFASGAAIEPMRYEPCSKCGVGMVSESIVEDERMWMAMMLSIKFCVQGSGTAAAVGGLLLRRLILSQGGNVKRINNISQNPS